MDYTYTWGEIVNTYKMATGKGGPAAAGFKDPKATSIIDMWRNNERLSFYTIGSEEMVKRLDQGYTYKGEIDTVGLPSVEYERPRWTYSENPEGDFDYDLYIMGEAEYFRNRPKRLSLGGISLWVEYDFSGGVSEKTIAKYGEFVGRVIENLQKRGHDIEISLILKSRHTYTDKKSKSDTFEILLSKFGEKVMAHDWSAIFSPGGFRHFMFLSLMMGGRQDGRKLTSGLGAPAGNAWKVDWDAKLRRIHIGVNCHDSNFPAEDMTAQFEKLSL